MKLRALHWLHNTLCTFFALQLDNETLSTEVTVEAEYIHAQKIVCPIALQEFGDDVYYTEPYKIDIAASNNGQTFSDIQTLVVFDSTCWECSDGHCNMIVSEIITYT